MYNMRDYVLLWLADRTGISVDQLYKLRIAPRLWQARLKVFTAKTFAGLFRTGRPD